VLAKAPGEDARAGTRGTDDENRTPRRRCNGLGKVGRVVRKACAHGSATSFCKIWAIAQSAKMQLTLGSVSGRSTVSVGAGRPAWPCQFAHASRSFASVRFAYCGGGPAQYGFFPGCHPRCCDHGFPASVAAIGVRSGLARRQAGLRPAAQRSGATAKAVSGPPHSLPYLQECRHFF